MSVRALGASERRRLKSEGHRLEPVAQVGRQGISPAFLAEVDRALASHELIKVRLRGEREERAEQIATLEEQLACTTVATVGSVAMLYRRHDDAAAARRDAASEEEP